MKKINDFKQFEVSQISKIKGGSATTNGKKDTRTLDSDTCVLTTSICHL